MTKTGKKIIYNYQLKGFTEVGNLLTENTYTFYQTGETDNNTLTYNQANCYVSLNTTFISPLEGLLTSTRKYAYGEDEIGYIVYKFYPIYDENGGNFPIIEKLNIESPLFYEFEIKSGDVVKVQRTWFYLVNKSIPYSANEFGSVAQNGSLFPEIYDMNLNIIENVYYKATVDIATLYFELATQGGVNDENSPQIGVALVNDISA